jgi:diguanylate cyclase (GGDEF)-like protein/PAS domain S-box-containing protein
MPIAGWYSPIWRSPLARRLLVYIVLFSSAITFALTAFQLYRDYRLDLGAIESDLTEIQEVHLKTLTGSLWATNTRELTTQLEGIIKLPNMQYAAVHEGDKLWASAGKNIPGNVIVRQYPMAYTHNDQPLTIGVLTVAVDLDGVYARLVDEALVILASNALKTFLVTAFILVIFHALVARHLARIVEFLDRLDIHLPMDRLALARPANTRGHDELDRLVEAINRMQDNVRDSFAAWQRSEARLRLFIDSVHDYAICMLDTEGRVASWNDGAARLMGYEARQIMGESFARFYTADEAARGQPAEALSVTAANGRHEDEGWRVRCDGQRLWMSVALSALRDEHGGLIGFGYIAHDLSAHRQAEDRLHHLVHYDSLTGLPNRTLFNDRLQQAMFEAERHERLVGVVILDLDQFKHVNDTLGHDAGDELLKHVSERLKAVVRIGDTVARLSGDEFAFVLADMGHVDDGSRVAQKILDALGQPFSVSGRDLFVTASLGMTIFPFDDGKIEGLLKNADIAMYRAKERGKNTYQFYAADMTAKANERAQLESHLRRALGRGELTLHFQPQVDVHSHRITGAEVLLRWHSAELGTVPPAQFIPVAEETGLIVPIGEWVMREACTRSRAWSEERGLRVAVNISARQFQDRGFASSVHRILRDTGFNPRHLELEITESLLMRQTEETLAALRALGDLGVRLAIDDFGTGYSSLAYLRRFPIDILKIDLTFVRDIPADPDAGAIATGIIALAHSLGIHVVAEGVETTGQLAFLRAQACDAVQGYYFSHPLPAGEFEKLLRAGRVLPVRAVK